MRIFVFGDSFADNLYEENYRSINKKHRDGDILKYIRDIRDEGFDDALWFTDWLEKWGYEVYNFGVGGCDNNDIISQFRNLDKFEFQEGDRIIIWMTSYLRFSWINENGHKLTIMPMTTPYEKNTSIDILKSELLWEQCGNREQSFLKPNGYLKTHQLSFYEYFINLYSKYKPILTSFCPNTINSLKNNKWIFDIATINNQKLLIKVNNPIRIETNEKCGDGHFSRYGNFYWAMIFDEIIKSNMDGNYLKSYYFTKGLEEKILSDKTIFPRPKKWD
jgi:hypothetical protein